MLEKANLKYKDIDLAISYELRRGSGDSLVFIHGLGACKNCFKDVWDFLGYQKYTILTYDLPGFGGSDKPRDFSYSIEDLSILSSLLIEKLNLKKVHLIGHSMGGAVGLLLCQEIKPIIRSFICLEGNLISEDCMGSRMAISYSLEDFQREGFNRLKSDISMGRNEPSAKDDSLDLYLNCLSKSDPYAFYRSSESLVKWSDSGKLLELFISLDKPKYYVFGDKNKNSPTVKLLSSIARVAISDSGHAMMNDNPKEFYEKLLEILR
jgi:pimeloyl-ACP methyl ester carboxylesterase